MSAIIEEPNAENIVLISQLSSVHDSEANSQFEQSAGTYHETSFNPEKRLESITYGVYSERRQKDKNSSFNKFDSFNVDCSRIEFSKTAETQTTWQNESSEYIFFSPLKYNPNLATVQSVTNKNEPNSGQRLLNINEEQFEIDRMENIILIYRRLVAFFETCFVRPAAVYLLGTIELIFIFYLCTYRMYSAFSGISSEVQNEMKRISLATILFEEELDISYSDDTKSDTNHDDSQVLSRDITCKKKTFHKNINDHLYIENTGPFDKLEVKGHQSIPDENLDNHDNSESDICPLSNEFHDIDVDVSKMFNQCDHEMSGLNKCQSFPGNLSKIHFSDNSILDDSFSVESFNIHRKTFQRNWSGSDTDKFEESFNFNKTIESLRGLNFKSIGTSELEGNHVTSRKENNPEEDTTSDSCVTPQPIVTCESTSNHAKSFNGSSLITENGLDQTFSGLSLLMNCSLGSEDCSHIQDNDKQENTISETYANELLNEEIMEKFRTLRYMRLKRNFLLKESASHEDSPKATIGSTCYSFSLHAREENADCLSNSQNLDFWGDGSYDSTSKLLGDELDTGAKSSDYANCTEDNIDEVLSNCKYFNALFNNSREHFDTRMPSFVTEKFQEGPSQLAELGVINIIREYDTPNSKEKKHGNGIKRRVSAMFNNWKSSRFSK